MSQTYTVPEATRHLEVRISYRGRESVTKIELKPHDAPTEEDILRRYSSDGLRRGEMTREAKREHLASFKITGERAEEILEKLYGSR